jgi:hypothetical protein
MGNVVQAPGQSDMVFAGQFRVKSPQKYRAIRRSFGMPAAGGWNNAPPFPIMNKGSGFT